MKILVQGNVTFDIAGEFSTVDEPKTRLKRRDSHTFHHLNKFPLLKIPPLFSSLSFFAESHIILRQLPVQESICMFLQYSFST